MIILSRLVRQTYAAMSSLQTAYKRRLPGDSCLGQGHLASPHCQYRVSDRTILEALKTCRVPSNMESISDKHIVMHAIASWGDNKPMSAFAVYAAEARRNIVITILVAGNVFHAKFMREFSKLPADRFVPIESRIHVVDITGMMVNPIEPLVQFAPAYDALYDSEPLTCLSSGKIVSGLAPPTVAIIDPFAAYAIEAIRAKAGNESHILSWMTAPAGASLRLFGPEEYGGVGVVVAKAQEEATKSGRSFADVKKEMNDNMARGELVHVPGMPPMYDYEWFPQEVAMEDSSFFDNAQKYMRDTDGTICVSSSIYEEEAMDAAKEWMRSMGKVWYPVGPLSLPEANPKADFTDRDRVVIDFLTRMQAKYGDNSVIYVSFGTVFWPKEPEKLWAIIDELVAHEVPFILAHTSMLASVPDEKKAFIAESGIGLEMAWSPQELILAHPATGWFITHGGWNSAQEAFSHRVPVIYWPFGADQPYNACLTVVQHNAGFELIEVRTGERGTRMPYRFENLGGSMPTFTVDAARAEFRSLLLRLRSDEGWRVRENFEKLAASLERTWDDGNESSESLKVFLQKFID